jgi:hypothetical protein
MPWQDQELPIPWLSPRMIDQSCLIGKGMRLPEVQCLVITYGGMSAGWAKKISPRIEIGGHSCEYQWYEHPGD